MERHSYHSPLYGSRKILKFLHFFFGFPLSVKDEGYTEFIFRPHFECAKLLFMILIISAVLLPTIMVILKVRGNETEIEEVSKFFNHFGLSSFDIYLHVSFIPINTVSMLCHFLSFRHVCTNISDLCHTMDKTKHDLKQIDMTRTETQSMKFQCGQNKALTNMTRIYFCNVVTSGCQIYAAYIVFFSEGKFGDWLSTKEKILLIISYVVYLARFGYPLISATSEYIITTVFDDTTKTFEDWIKIVVKTTKYEDINDTSDHCIEIMNDVQFPYIDDDVNNAKESIARVVNTGVSLSSVVTKTNKAFGGMIFNTYCTCLILSTISLYGASSVFLPNMAMSKQLIWPFTVAQLMLALMSFLRVYYITNAAQKLIKVIKKARMSLEYFLECVDKTGITKVGPLRHQLKILSDSPITPMSTFSLCNSTLLSTSATVMTYLIILIQFKLTEK